MSITVVDFLEAVKTKVENSSNHGFTDDKGLFQLDSSEALAYLV